MKSKEIIQKKLRELTRRIETRHKSSRHVSDGLRIRQIYNEIDSLRHQISLLEWILTEEP